MKLFHQLFFFWQVIVLLGKTYSMSQDLCMEHFLALKNYITHWGRFVERQREPCRLCWCTGCLILTPQEAGVGGHRKQHQLQVLVTQALWEGNVKLPSYLWELWPLVCDFLVDKIILCFETIALIKFSLVYNEPNLKSNEL